jgi:hypothetical protein
VLDTDPKLGFDNLNAWASEIFGMPIAPVNLIGAGRPWLTSRHGLETTETPRNVAFCGNAILRSVPFVVRDGLGDVCFDDDLLVTGGSRGRAYAGVPPFEPHSHALGAPCAIDHQPRRTHIVMASQEP